MLAETTTAPPYHQQYHYPMASVTSTTNNPYVHHHGYPTTNQTQPPQTSSTYGKEIEQLESLAIALCSQEIVEACQSLDISQGKVHKLITQWNVKNFTHYT